MDFSKILDFFNQPRLVFGVGLSTGIILFLPPQVLQGLGLFGLLDNSRAYVGITFIVTVVYCSVHISSLGLSWLNDKKKERETKRTRHKYLENLTKSEQEILNQFISHGTKTQRLDFNSGVVNGLVRKGIIFRASSIATTDFMDNSWYGPKYYCDHNMASWAWDYLNDYRELLGSVNNSDIDRSCQNASE